MFDEQTMRWLEDDDAIAAPARPRRRFRTLCILPAVLVVLVASVVFASSGAPRGTIELTTEPAGALVSIDGRVMETRTPLRATLTAGAHEIELSYEGFEAQRFSVDVAAGQTVDRGTVALMPVSEPGRMTVSIAVEPLAAAVTVDGVVHSHRRVLHLADMDPVEPHTIEVRADGYAPIIRRIGMTGLESAYRFELQPLID